MRIHAAFNDLIFLGQKRSVGLWHLNQLITCRASASLNSEKPEPATSSALLVRASLPWVTGMKHTGTCRA